MIRLNGYDPTYTPPRNLGNFLYFLVNTDDSCRYLAVSQDRGIDLRGVLDKGKTQD